MKKIQIMSLDMIGDALRETVKLNSYVVSLRDPLHRRTLEEMEKAGYGANWQGRGNGG